MSEFYFHRVSRVPLIASGLENILLSLILLLQSFKKITGWTALLLPVPWKSLEGLDIVILRVTQRKVNKA